MNTASLRYVFFRNPYVFFRKSICLIRQSICFIRWSIFFFDNLYFFSAIHIFFLQSICFIYNIHMFSSKFLCNLMQWILQWLHVAEQTTHCLHHFPMHIPPCHKCQDCAWQWGEDLLIAPRYIGQIIRFIYR